MSGVSVDYVVRLEQGRGPRPSPAVLSAKGDILAWNRLASALLGDFSAVPLRQRNLCWQRFLGDPGRVALDPEEAAQTAAQSVASLRAAYVRYPRGRPLQDMLTQLRRCDEFRRARVARPPKCWPW